MEVMIQSASDNLLYLDNAAMTWPKPPSVYRAVSECMKFSGGNPGRSAHSMATAAAETVYDCRKSVAEMFGTSAENVIFTLNTTYALNTAIKGLMPKGGHAICSDMEHNSVWRPLAQMQKDGLCTYSVFETEAGGIPDELIIANIKRKVRPETKLIVCTHSSNICPFDMPISKIGAFCKANGYKFIVDGAQSAGRLPIDMRSMNIDALCIPGQKGLFGPAGVGMLLLGQDVSISTLIEGGSGVNSLERFMPQDYPERLEAGTLPVPAIAGLSQGIKEIRNIGIGQIKKAEDSLFQTAKNILDRKEIVTYGKNDAGNVLMFNIAGKTSEYVASELNKFGICVRAGFHCAALAHKTLGTDTDGGVRISFSPMNKPNSLNLFSKAINQIILS